MPNLVGIGNSQVPTNAMLGGLAYQDSVGEIDIEKIKARTGNTAKDIFVYDTRKDSDGGAWRKKATTQSWYNESVSSIRGARKEFPAVAIIVVEASQVTIFDGDDPNCSMWMVFKQSMTGLGAMVGYTSFTIGSCTMLNGMLMVGMDASNQPNVAGLRLINFISEHFNWKANITGRNSSLHWPIIDRNGGHVNINVDSNLIVNEVINDVDAIVLPNAPIDASTGLPTPTIAIATLGGVSVIRGDGTVVNLIKSTTEMRKVHFQGSRLHINSSAVGGHWIYDIIPSTNSTLDPADGHFEYWDPNYNNLYNPAYIGWNNPSIAANYIGTTSHNGGVSGLTSFDYNKNDYTKSSVAFITSTYNTGYMVGDIKGAFLSDTDDTNITGSELITNGTFDSNVNNWVENTSTNTHSSGRMQITRSGGTGATAYQAFTTEVGKTYVATAEVNSSGSRGDLHVRDGTGWGGTGLLYVAGTASQTKILTGSFTATSTTSTIAFGVDNDGTSIFVDNVSVRIAEEDRSINQKELQVFGTITKTPVATGAELVAYSGFNSSNYLFQPHNTDLEFGTDDYSVMLWYKPGTGSIDSREIFANLRGSSNHWVLSKEYTNKFVFDTVTDPNNRTLSIWNHVCGVRESGIAKLYVNGQLVGSAAANDNINDTSDGLIIGQNPDNNDWRTRGSLALLKISASAASAEQVKKIFDDEKYLYHENAKCTLHGTSDEIKALGFDDTTNVLHVGTSAGRSDFRGLNRINNTTTAVTTAISASNEFVAEQ